MDTHQQQRRSEYLDRLLTQLRWAMEGGLRPCLPSGLTTRAQQRRAIYRTAEELTLCYATVHAVADAATLSVCRNRLYGVLTFLFYECNTEDCRFDKLLQLLQLELGVLCKMLGMAKHTPHRLLRHYRWACDDPVELAGDWEGVVQRHLAQEDTQPHLRLCTRAVDLAINTLKNS